MSRLFSEFKQKQLMQLEGARLVIRSGFALEKIARDLDFKLFPLAASSNSRLAGALKKGRA